MDSLENFCMGLHLLLFEVKFHGLFFALPFLSALRDAKHCLCWRFVSHNLQYLQKQLTQTKKI